MRWFSFSGGRPLRWVFLGAVAILFGCVRGDQSECLRYDAATDTFHFLQLYRNIGANDADEQAWLLDNWNRRANLIMPIPELAILESPAYVRKSKSEYSRTDLSNQTKDKPEVITTTVPLDTVVIRPGRLFLSGEKTLCYYHQITVPGKTIDAVLHEISQAVKKTIAQGVANEQKRRAGGGKRIAWDLIRSDLLTEKTEEEKAKPESPPREPIQAVSDETLDRLAKHAAGPADCLHREGARVELVLPASADDAVQVKEIFEQFKKKEAKPGERSPLEAIHPAADPARGFVLSVDFGALLDSKLVKETGLSDDGRNDPVFARTVQFFQDRKIPIDEALTHAQVMERFAAGKLE